MGSVLDVVAGRFPGCGLRHEEGEREGGREEEEAGRGREAGTTSENGEKSDLETAGVEAAPPPCSPSNGKGKTEDPLSSLRTARPYRTLGGVLAAEAIALLKEFYETGNPSAPRPNRPAAAAATRAARKAAAAEAAAGAAAEAARAAAASNGDCGAAT